MTLQSAAPQARIWRVGRAPEPWAWPDRKFAGGQRWDDSEGTFRTVYAANDLYGCFVEILAIFRPDPSVVSELAAIAEDPADAIAHPSRPPGEIPMSWTDSRRITSATARGIYCDVSAATTIAGLRREFVAAAIALGFADLDAAAIKTAQPRALTQLIASWLYRTDAGDGEPWDGVAFRSRHGDELRMWAIFERPNDSLVSHLLTIESESEITRTNRDLLRAFELHGLVWATPPYTTTSPPIIGPGNP